MRTRTKIICTMGPAVHSYEKILELIDAGMSVARLNFSHGTHEYHKQTIDHLKKARKERGVALAIMLDTKGPEIRVGVLDEEIAVDQGEEFLLTRDSKESASDIPICPGVVLDSLEKGDVVLFDDGYIGSEVVEVTKKGVRVSFSNSGVIKSQKGVNIPHVDILLPAMTERDIKDIEFGCQLDIDIIAASFIRSAEHVLEIRALLKKCGKDDVHIIAKIESSLGVKNFDSIVQVVDGIMIARGDLGVELPIEEVPVLQKMMIRKCIQASKPVVTATQMLESMINNPRPTRAEASDVANAIYDSTSAVMLSGETAVGKYPIQTVKLMRSIIESAEADFSYHGFFLHNSQVESHDISSSVSLASVKTAYSSDAKAIFVFTNSGSTARLIARFRPSIPIVALAANQKTYNQLAFNWGVYPVKPTNATKSSEALEATSAFAQKHGIVQFGDLVVVIAGTPFGISGITNKMVVQSIGEVLVRGNVSQGEKISGQVQIILTPDTVEDVTGKIVVLSEFNETYAPIIRKAKAIILQNHPEDEESEELASEKAKELGIPILVRADGALSRLRDNQTITIDPEKGTVYRKTPS